MSAPALSTVSGELTAQLTLGAAATAVYEMVDLCRELTRLHEIGLLMWAGYYEGKISDGEATYLSSIIERQRSWRRMAAWGTKPLGKIGGRQCGRFTPRQRPRSPDRKASIDRRRTLGGSSALPHKLRHHYTEGQRSVLCIIAGEVKRHGICDWPIDKIAAIAGVCRTTVQTTLHEARRLAALDDPRVRKDFLDWREKVAITSGEREADNRLSAISAMLTWAVDRGQANANHLRGFRRMYHADRSEIIWLPEHIASFMKVAPIEMQRAIILALHTGQREGDLLRLPWSGYDGLRIGLRQGKARRGGRLGPLVEIPCTGALRRMLDGMERVSPLILTTKTGQSLKKRYFARLWNEAMERAGLQSVLLPGSDQWVELHFHDLRGTAVTMLSEAGCTPQQIATITGHSLKTVHRILERYLARTRGLAEEAISNFENSPRTKFANQLQTVAHPKITRKGKSNV